jgi:hypothetical protein
MSTPANFNDAKPIIDPAKAAMLLIDHQSHPARSARLGAQITTTLAWTG